MSMEDELSTIAEQLYLEQLNKKEWLRKEADKMAQWEKEQLLKDEMEVMKRKQKLLDLEEKKMKLAELRKKQRGDVASLRQNDLLSARNEALKLSKQMRIQNKAKFVSKRRKGKEVSEKDLFSGSMQLPSVAKMPSEVSLFSATHTGHTAFNKKDINFAENDSDFEQDSNVSTSMSRYESLQTETELHCALKELMAEKRGLRLQLMQKKTSANSSEDILEVKGFQLRIKQISGMETYIKGRVEKLVKKEAEAIVEMEEVERTNAVALPSSDFDMKRRLSSTGLHPTSSNIYHDIETTLREINELVLKSDVVGLFNNNILIPVEDQDVLSRTAGILKMKTCDFIVKVKQNGDDDINGYESKLERALVLVQTFLDKVVALKEKGRVGDVTSCAPQSDSKSFSGTLAPTNAATTSTAVSTATATVLQPDTTIEESQSMPTLGSHSNVTAAQNVCVDDSIIVMSSTSSSAILASQPGMEKNTTTAKESMWEEVKRVIPGSEKPNEKESISLSTSVETKINCVDLETNKTDENNSVIEKGDDDCKDRQFCWSMKT